METNREPRSSEPSSRSETKSHVDDSLPLYIVLLSVHGLVRAHDPELGRDADTGGQVQYVLDLARGLARHPGVERVDLVTRLVEDARVSDDYARPEEKIADKARLVRIPCGPRRYLRKESLWSHLDGFADNLLRYLRGERRTPHIIHAHYADAAYVGRIVSGLLDIPLVFTGHSLGRDKKRRLLDRGMSADTIESRYRITRRIEAEETALDHAAFVVASTTQEVETQYRLYDYYNPKRMLVIPPGIDPRRFRKPSASDRSHPPIASEIARFLRDPAKPIVLAIARPDPKKNLETLVRAFGERPSLRERANLVVVAGSRSDVRDLEKDAQRVWTELLLGIDRYDLYGHVAYPKSHTPDDIPDLYHLVARSRGVFVNPALVEPFGLTLLEAAASGLPVIATNDGGPRDILANCKNGVLVDPLDPTALAEALEDALRDTRRWKRWSRSGAAGVERFYTWDGHVRRYIQAVHRITVREKMERIRTGAGIRKRLLTLDRFVLADVDDTMTGDEAGLARLLEVLEASGPNVGFGVVTGRNLRFTLQALKEWKIPMLDVLITSVGTEIFYGPSLVEDLGWSHQIRYRWNREEIRRVLAALPGVRPQPREAQSPYKVSFFYDPSKAPSRAKIVQRLRKRNLQANLVVSHGMFLDALPIRASKGQAVRYFAMKWDIPFDHLLVAGDAGNDEDMLAGNTLGVVVANHTKEIEHLRGRPRIHFANAAHAWGILEGIERYGFLGTIRTDAADTEEEAGGGDEAIYSPSEAGTSFPSP